MAENPHLFRQNNVSFDDTGVCMNVRYIRQYIVVHVIAGSNIPAGPKLFVNYGPAYDFLQTTL